MKKRLCNLISCILLILCASAHASDDDLTMAEANRRFILKRDFVTFLPLWEKKLVKYHSSFTYDENTETLSFFDSNRTLLAVGKARQSDENFIRYGSWKRYYQSGKLLAKINYQDNVREGKATGYYQNGKQALTAHYIRGSYHGVRLRYDSTGKLLDTVTFARGKPLSYNIAIIIVPSFQRPDHLPRGTIYDTQYDVWVHRDDNNEFISMWYRNGSMLCELNARNTGKKNEMLHGKAVYWHENGAKWMIGHYDFGKPAGSWMFYDEDGNKRDEAVSDSQYIFTTDTN